MQTAEAAKILRVARAAETSDTAAGTNVKAAGEATAVKDGASVEKNPAGRASVIMAVPHGTAVAAVESRAVGLLALRVDATMRHGHTAAAAHLHPGARKSRSTAMDVLAGGTTGDAESAMRAANSY